MSESIKKRVSYCDSFKIQVVEEALVENVKAWMVELQISAENERKKIKMIWK